MPPKRKNRSSVDAAVVNKQACIPQQGADHSKSEDRTFEGARLSFFLKLIYREIEKERLANKVLPEKIWCKKQFAVGMNEVTRCLERMPPSTTSIPQQVQKSQDQGQAASISSNRCAFPEINRLQAVLVAWDCSPKWLTKHLPSLAYSRDVPIIYVKDRKQGSVRLGELLMIKTAIAVGVKDNGNGINQLIERILLGQELNNQEEKPELSTC